MVQLSDDMDRIMTLTAVSDIVPAVLSAIGRATYIKISSYRACVTTESADIPSRPIKAEIISDAFALSSWAEDLVSSCDEKRSSQLSLLYQNVSHARHKWDVIFLRIFC